MKFTDMLLHPPFLFFLLGILASIVKSGLELPESIKKFLSIYLLISIGLHGGYEIYHSGFTQEASTTILTCIAFSFFSPFLSYAILKLKQNKADSIVIASSYGSVSAVTFITTVAFITYLGVQFDGYMTAALALMESPAIIAGLLIYNLNDKKLSLLDATKSIVHKSILDPYILLLMGSIVIGYLCKNQGKLEMQPFTDHAFKGMLTLYLLDMGIVSGAKIGELKKSGIFLILFALICPIISALIGIGVSYLLHLSIGNALLLTILFGSASYIAVPATMRLSIPEANIGLVVPLSLLVTFLFNVVIGLPIYYDILKAILIKP